MDKSSSLGMSPGHPKKYPRSTSVKAWGCPRHPLFINKKAPGHFSIRYIFIASYNMSYSWSVFIFVVCFIFNKVGPHHIYFGVRHAPLYCIIFYFGVRHASLFCIIFTLEWDTLRCFALERYSFHCHCFSSVLVF